MGRGSAPDSPRARRAAALTAFLDYEVLRQRIAELMRAAIALPSIATLDADVLLRALAIYELDRVDFAEAYLVAQAEATGVNEIISF